MRKFPFLTCWSSILSPYFHSFLLLFCLFDFKFNLENPHRPSGKSKENPQNKRKYLQIICLIRDIYPEYIKNTYNSTIKKQCSWQMEKNLNRDFSKDGQMANKHRQRYSALFIFREMQIKNTSRYAAHLLGWLKAKRQ